MSEGMASPRVPSFARPLFIALIYSLAHGISLLNRGLFWDDWVFWQQDRHVVAAAAKAMGSTWPASINDLFYYSLGGITANRLVTFLTLLYSALVLYAILRHIPWLTAGQSMWIATVFGIVPAYESRIALVMVGYPLSLALFMSGLWLLVRFAPRVPVLVRLLCAFLFFASFRTGSLLVFFAVVPVVLLLVHPPERFDLRSTVRTLAGYADQLVLPVAYWVITRIWFAPSGLYAGYNTPDGGGVRFVPAFLKGMAISLVGPWGDAATALLFKAPLIVALLAAATAAVVAWRWPAREKGASWLLLLSGFALVVLAVAPYAAVGKVPSYQGWETRHQLLIPFGIAVIVVAAATLVSRVVRLRGAAAGLLVLVVLGSVAAHVNSYIRYERDWLKQAALIEGFKASPEVKDAHFVLLEDETTDLDRADRLFYEYTGMLTEAFGDQSRFAVQRSYYRGVWAVVGRRYHEAAYYKLAHYEGGGPDCIVRVMRGELDLREAPQVLRLMVLDWVDRDALRAELRRALVVEARPYTARDAGIDYSPQLCR